MSSCLSQAGADELVPMSQGAQADVVEDEHHMSVDEPLEPGFQISTIAAIRAHLDQDEEVKLEFVKDYKAYSSQRFPYEKQEAGRQREVDHLSYFKAVEDVVPNDDD